MNNKAQTALHKRLLFPAFQRWVNLRQDWKNIYHISHNEPRLYYQKAILSKIVQAWRRFTIESKDFESLVEKAKLNRIDRLIKNGLRSWISVVDDVEKSKIELASRRFPGLEPHALVAARKYGTIWLKKARSSILVLPSCQRRDWQQVNREKIILGRDILPFPSSEKQLPSRTRRAPRKPTFLIDQDPRLNIATEREKHDSTIPPAITHKSQLPTKLAAPLISEKSYRDELIQTVSKTEMSIQTETKDLTVTTENSELNVGTGVSEQGVDDSTPPTKTEMSIQTDPEPSSATRPLGNKATAENIDRQDSGIDVVRSEQVIEKSGSMLALEKIMSSIPSDQSFSKCHKSKAPLNIQDIELKLLEFRALKTQYLENKPRIGQLQLEIHDMLFGNIEGDLDAKTQELEKVMEQVKCYEETLESRNQEIILLSMQIEILFEA